MRYTHMKSKPKHTNTKLSHTHKTRGEEPTMNKYHNKNHTAQ